jgi:hypothetical protein
VPIMLLGMEGGMLRVAVVIVTSLPLFEIYKSFTYRHLDDGPFFSPRSLTRTLNDYRGRAYVTRVLVESYLKLTPPRTWASATSTSSPSRPCRHDILHLPNCLDLFFIPSSIFIISASSDCPHCSLHHNSNTRHLCFGQR